MEPVSCGIIEDLLPLYADGVCGGESKKAVEDHLAVCPDCREKLERMRETLPSPDAAESPDDTAMLKRMSSVWKKNTGLEWKPIVFFLLFYVVAVVVLTVAQQLREQVNITFEIKYMLGSYLVTCLLYLLLGSFAAYLAGRPGGGAWTVLLLFVLAAVPIILVILAFFAGPWLPKGILFFVIKHIDVFLAFSCVLLGCVLFREVSHLLRRKRGKG